MEMSDGLFFFQRKIRAHMKTVLSMILVFCMCFVLSGCGPARPSPEQIANAYYGPYPEDYEQVVKNHMEMLLIDPDSAKYYFQGQPLQGWFRLPLYQGFEYGWYGHVAINAKNRMGGYTGATPFEYLIRSNSITQ